MKRNIARLISSLKNATLKNKLETFVDYSDTTILLLEYFLTYKLIKGYFLYREKNKILIRTEPRAATYLSVIRMHSRSTLRKYTKFKELLHMSKNCYFGIISTTRGLSTINEAIFHGLSGEVLFIIK